jgi:hypothetical protein
MRAERGSAMRSYWNIAHSVAPASQKKSARWKTAGYTPL